MAPAPSATVFSWYMPEIEKIVRNLAKHDYPSELFKQNFDPGLDEYHVRLMQRYLARSLSEVFTELSIGMIPVDLPHSYYTNGSSEGLFHLLARHTTYFPNTPLYQFEGEYQGYREYAMTLGTNIYDVPFGMNPGALRPGVFIISVPSAVDGNIVEDSVIYQICQSDHHVIIDCAYADMAMYPDLRKIVLHERIAAVVGSMSKPFGLYYHRIGFLWARDAVPSLYGNRWFKNIFSISVGNEVLDQFTAGELARRYRPWQLRACDDASDHLGSAIEPSDVWLLGHALPNAQDAIPHSFGPFKRGPGYRFCLTPYYMAYAKEENENE